MEIPGYNLVRSGNLSNENCAVVCIYYKSCLRIININYLSECLKFQLIVGDKLYNFIALCRYPSQLQDQFESFKEPFLLVVFMQNQVTDVKMTWPQVKVNQ